MAQSLSKNIAWAITFAAIGGIYLLLRRNRESNPPSLINTDLETYNPEYDMSTNTNLPRGYRNNNPLNIRYNAGNAWKGKVLPNTDRNNTFEQFIDLAYGYRAALSLMRTYIRKYGCDTVRKIITKWAPPSENNTDDYIQHVCEFSGLTPETTLARNDRDKLCKMAYAMSIIENGNTPETRAAGLPNMDIINEAWKLL